MCRRKKGEVRCATGGRAGARDADARVQYAEEAAGEQAVEGDAALAAVAQHLTAAREHLHLILLK